VRYYAMLLSSLIFSPLAESRPAVDGPLIDGRPIGRSCIDRDQALAIAREYNRKVSHFSRPTIRARTFLGFWAVEAFEGDYPAYIHADRWLRIDKKTGEIVSHR
jgi:hypothetical protein